MIENSHVSELSNTFQPLRRSTSFDSSVQSYNKNNEHYNDEVTKQQQRQLNLNLPQKPLSFVHKRRNSSSEFIGLGTVTRNNNATTYMNQSTSSAIASMKQELRPSNPKNSCSIEKDYNHKNVKSNTIISYVPFDKSSITDMNTATTGTSTTPQLSRIISFQQRTSSLLSRSSSNNGGETAGDDVPDIGMIDTFDSSYVDSDVEDDGDDDNVEDQILLTRHDNNQKKLESDIFRITFDPEEIDTNEKSEKVAKNIDIDDDYNEDDDNEFINTTANTSPSAVTKFLSWNDCIQQLYYIITFAIIGTVLRAHIERFFGLDCEMKSHEEENNSPFYSIFTSISTNVCVTASGTTSQTGGALFTSLPANMLGSFVMGLLNPITTLLNNNKGVQAGASPLPWFRYDHPLQHHHALHKGLQVGFCGCLTTFSAWNTQMVVMMDGTGTVLGSQVGSALFGYMIGVACAISSYIFGQSVAVWISHNDYSNPNTRTMIDDDDQQDPVTTALEEGSIANNITKENMSATIVEVDGTKNEESVNTKNKPLGAVVCDLIALLFGVQYGPLIISTTILAAFIAKDIQTNDDDEFYRKMWMSVLLAPFGALMRWRLSTLNHHNYNHNRNQPITFKSACTSLDDWFPWGTFGCNVIASVVSIIAYATHAKLIIDDGMDNTSWISPFIQALSGGFAGSLSTVSTLMKEMSSMNLNTAYGHIYCWLTILCSMVVGLILYRPLMMAL